ncbi:DUF983 domain-containing protein [Rhizobium rhizogenes]|uniref:DUF983 domain-containing protein n=1 Tax=Rhizobium rhizogenes TaxID=359 RepID=A0AA92C111_RHIRH|nr:DUF983 domain-containing protein [Rhizobium rhizogenes]PVE51824.1 hypothetical protein DC430_17035 [Rhizobium rhizogenes]PVE64280.1 hypothetical protein DC415_17905 [Agrobacterium tumefaciens]PVE73543.1 hypothetical protein DCP16_17905 [Sphingomonas sp. TPD3009]
MSETQTVQYSGEKQERPLGRSIMRGISCRCPACGSGRLFKAWLKPVDQCAACGEDLHHQRSDDLPPYISIMILGHVAVGGFLMTDLILMVPMWVHFAIWVPITILVALLTIQPIKGGVIGLQWALRMHGFSNEPEKTQIDGSSH